MFGFEISVNGQRICTAGSDVVCAIGLDYTCREPGIVHLRAGGIPAADSSEHANWMMPEVGVGDEITIRILEINAPDPAHIYNPMNRPKSSG